MSGAYVRCKRCGGSMFICGGANDKCDRCGTPWRLGQLMVEMDGLRPERPKRSMKARLLSGDC